MSEQPSNHPIKKILAFLLSFGPGIFAIGYTIGTGSVTSMIVAGNSFGMDLLWVLFFSCLFSGVLIYVSGHYYLVSGETILFSVRKHLPMGKFLAIAMIATVGIGQWNSLIGILGITSNVIYEILELNFPGISTHQYGVVLALAVVIIGTFYTLLLKGNYSLFEKVLALFVSMMGLSFVFTLLFVFPLPTEIILGLVPKIPEVEGAGILIAAFVGTTMAAATFLSRPLFIQGKGWSLADAKTQRNDSIVAALLIFTISGAIMAVASGSLYGTGTEITHVLDMSGALEPSVGKFAVTIFFAGTLSAGLSSIFPCLMIVPLMLADFTSGKLDVSSRRFRLVTGLASVLALSVPLVGFNPIKGQIFTQVFNVFGLPLVVISILILWNRKVPGLPKNRVLTNVVLVAALVFSLVISWNGLVDIFN
ncbi:NRAMP family divalent metal transporter [Marinoscillum furvescens]|uniref:Mn2+/Fe2+ NRAMP family transporter n=1 Tax=Marinoscillum furvescens DSM 4134 TaxID=1122208 RepID=A0A3D9L0Z1_MARFU|nr:divalent metal cation transporter [Marinoscillum furvescens]RED95295.1 Mn2+/Fe2+ NRAMP family transporter [Marinoscillum furvescens DSM 4134]